MRALAAFVAAAVLAAVGVLAGWLVRGEDKPAVVTTTVSRTVTSPGVAAGLPQAVERTRAAIVRAARARDLAALAALIPSSGFTYTYGGPFEGGPVKYWQNLEQTTSERPLETVARILSLPYSLQQGHYVWPFAYGTPKNELTTYERGLLGSLVNSYVGEDYYGWRAGLRPDGTWSFFVSGD